MNFNSQITGFIFNVQRFSLHDGPGIRTTVFFKGCPLHCLWCHNPESIDFDMEIGWEPRRCVLCGACIEACPAKCHHVDEKGLHVFDRQTCTQCGRCAKVCMSQALTVVGHRRTANDILNEVLKDRRYYQRSGGGITLSGGEPSAQSVFAMELLKLAKNENLHTCVETCGQTSFRILQDMASFTDLFLYDIKETDPIRHKNCTGTDNFQILENLRRLNSRGVQIVLRCPIIPGLNNRPDHFGKVSVLANELENVQSIQLMPYHPFAASKYSRVGRVSLLPDISAPTVATVADWIKAVAAKTKKPVSA